MTLASYLFPRLLSLFFILRFTRELSPVLGHLTVLSIKTLLRIPSPFPFFERHLLHA